MRLVLYTNALSEHQLPLARELVGRVGAENFRYVYTSKNGQKLQASQTAEKWVVYGDHPWLEEAEAMLVGGMRPIDLIERRLSQGKKTFYMSERWFKPWTLFDLRLFNCLISVRLPGWVRLIVPSYRKMARRFVKLFDSPDYKFLSIGPWAKSDMLRLCKWFGQNAGQEQILDWGYFVAPSKFHNEDGKCRSKGVLKVLWCGRLLALKRVGDVVRAVGEYVRMRRPNNLLPEIMFDIYGEGPERWRLEKLAKGLPVAFHGFVPLDRVRELMREHDVYVLSSNGYEGWGCVVSEAIEEEMKVLGTFEAGASAAILPQSNLYHAGDWKTLARKLAGDIQCVPIGKWSAEAAAERLLKELSGL